MFFAVDPDEVVVLARPIAATANAVAACDLGADLAPLALALPGSSSADSSPVLGWQWAALISELSEAASLQAARLTIASTSYAVSETSVGASLSAGVSLSVGDPLSSGGAVVKPPDTRDAPATALRE